MALKHLCIGSFLLLWAFTILVSASSSDETSLFLLSGTTAQCLDGSPAGFYHRLSRKRSRKSWIVHFEGGAYCPDAKSCIERSHTDLGSSINWPKSRNYSGFLSANPTVNPHFHNWNVIAIQYCDGAFYASDRADSPVNVSGTDLWFRGKDIVVNVFDVLLNQLGMDKAKEVIISGCSAGGVGVFLHLDWIRQRIPSHIRVVGFPDSGFFLDIPNYKGQYIWGPVYASAMALHNVTFSNDECFATFPANESYKCALSQYVAPFVKTPLFVMNSLADSYQLVNLLMLDCVRGHELVNCSNAELTAVHSFREKMISDLKQGVLEGKSSNTVFLPTCVTHCGTSDPPDTPCFWQNTEIEEINLRTAFAHWYFGKRGAANLIDGPYPSDACKFVFPA
jgi:hypothetical protein